MIVGLLDKKIIIQKGVDTITSVLTSEPVFEKFMETFANVYVRVANARFGESEELVYTTEFTIWYSSKSKLINNKFRIKYNDQYYRILEIIETEQRQAIKILAEHFYGN